jgi:hypothetical protein
VVWFDGWWVVSRDRPWLGVAYGWAVLSGSDLWVKCASVTPGFKAKPDAHRMYAQDQVVIHTVRM